MPVKSFQHRSGCRKAARARAVGGQSRARVLIALRAHTGAGSHAFGNDQTASTAGGARTDHPRRSAGSVSRVKSTGGDCFEPADSTSSRATRAQRSRAVGAPDLGRSSSRRPPQRDKPTSSIRVRLSQIGVRRDGGIARLRSITSAADVQHGHSTAAKRGACSTGEARALGSGGRPHH